MKISKSWIESTKAQFPKGTRVELDYSEGSVKKGTRGTVVGVDDGGGVAVKWDTGEFQAVLFELGDIIHKVG